MPTSRSQSGSPAQVVVTTGTPFTMPLIRPAPPSWSTPFAPCPMSRPWSALFSPQGAAQISRNRHIGYVRVEFDEQAGNLPEPAIKKVVNTTESFEAPGYQSPSEARPLGWWPRQTGFE